MAKRLTIPINVVRLAKLAAGPNPSKQDAYISALTDTVKREFGKRCIDAIIERTLDGIDKNNSPFVKYSESYKKSDTFKIYGKSSSVTLKLTGDMQAAIDVVEITQQKVVLGFVDQLENDKAHGHVNGSNKLPVRDFWGISEKKQVAILKETIRDYEDIEDILILQETPTQVDIRISDEFPGQALDFFSLEQDNF